MDISKLIEEVINGSRKGGPKARVVRLGDMEGAADLFAALRGAVPDCGEKDCPIHGGPKTDEDQLLTQDDVNAMIDEMDSDGALAGATAAIASAHNAIVGGDHLTATVDQRQADLYLKLYDIHRVRETEAKWAAEMAAAQAVPQPEQQNEASSRNEEEPVS